jgi:hypothetical protein
LKPFLIIQTKTNLVVFGLEISRNIVVLKIRLENADFELSAYEIKAYKCVLGAKGRTVCLIFS